VTPEVVDMAVRVSVYKGHPILEIHESADCTDKFPVSLGLKKVSAILNNLNVAKQFVAQNTKTEAAVASVTLPKLG
jgi:hypothetical protein